MYAQNPRGTNLPRNYSGNAFRYPPIRTEGEPLVGEPPDNTLLYDEPLTSETPEQKTTPPPDGSGDTVEREQTGHGEAASSRLSLAPFGGRGLGSEELLLLGMLLLLNGGEGQSELMMCLLMLLFCG